MKMVNVILELRTLSIAASSINRAAKDDTTSTLALDPILSPVAVRPDSRQLELSLEAAQEQLVLVPGSVEDSQVKDLSNRPKVVGIYTDGEVSPFDPRADSTLRWQHMSYVALAARDGCPIPPCDCELAESHGCLLDVAEYLGATRICEEGIRGDGVVIGIVDGGITAERKLDQDRPGLVPRVVNGWPKENWGTIARWNRHGNKMALDALGIAPRAEIYDIRISDGAHDGARISDAIAGIHWAIEKYRRDGTPQILCCGWGLFQQSDDPLYATHITHPLTRKIVEAMDEGILVLFAAGNGGQACPFRACGEDTGPGKSIWGANGHPRVMTVGTVNKDEQWIGYSSQGPAALDEFKPDFCGISHFAGYFDNDTGTSTACAVASGVVALLKQARPTLTQEAAKRLLKTTAKGIGPPGWNRHAGAGIIQAKAAYDALVGRSIVRTIDVAHMERLELENQHLRELFIELALEKRIRAGTLAPTE
jgi:hypothetical protein